MLFGLRLARSLPKLSHRALAARGVESWTNWPGGSGASPKLLPNAGPGILAQVGQGWGPEGVTLQEVARSMRLVTRLRRRCTSPEQGDRMWWSSGMVKDADMRRCLPLRFRASGKKHAARPSRWKAVQSASSMRPALGLGATDHAHQGGRSDRLVGAARARCIHAKTG